MKLSVCCALLVALLIPAGAAAKAPSVHADAAETAGSGLDLVQASFGEVGTTMRLELRTAADWTVARLSPRTGRTLCVLLITGPRPQSRVCAVPGPPGGAALALRWTRLDSRGRPVRSRDLPGTVTHPDARTLRASFAPAAAGLQPGLFRWRARSGWVDATSTCPPGNTACTDVVPDRGSIPARIAPGPVIGCTASGPAEVFSGPHTRRVALTFDDGPGTVTPALLDLLARHHARATFFVLGQAVPGREALLARMLREGDAIGNHSFSHRDLGAGGATDEIVRTNTAIHRATGYTPCVFRPPYGSSGPALRAEVEAQGMRSIRWDVDPADWQDPGADAIAARVLAAVHDGAIVLSHDGGGSRTATLAAYARIIPELQRRGYALVTVPELLGYAPVYATAAQLTRARARR